MVTTRYIPLDDASTPLIAARPQSTLLVGVAALLPVVLSTIAVLVLLLANTTAEPTTGSTTVLSFVPSASADPVSGAEQTVATRDQRVPGDVQVQAPQHTTSGSSHSRRTDASKSAGHRSGGSQTSSHKAATPPGTSTKPVTVPVVPTPPVTTTPVVPPVIDPVPVTTAVTNLVTAIVAPKHPARLSIGGLLPLGADRTANDRPVTDALELQFPT